MKLASGSLAERSLRGRVLVRPGRLFLPSIAGMARHDEADAERAVRRFREAVLATTRRRHYTVETGMALNKMVFATDVAARFEGVHIESVANEATWVRLASVADYDRENCGGLFFEVLSRDLAATSRTWSGLVTRRSRRSAWTGRTPGLAGHINGRGVDRFVPVGRALAFDSTWDGTDLLVEFSRRVVVE